VTTATEPITDAAGDVFDPELHATKPSGEPARRTDGTFRKKRRDAGGRRTAAAAAPRKSSTEGMPRALKEQHARHVRAIRDSAAVPLTVLSFVDPVDAYCVSELVDPLSEALATVAQDQPQLAAMLDRLSGAGGWSAVVAVVAVGAVQIAHNHGKVPENIARMMGAKPRSEIEAILMQRARAMQQQAPAPEAVPDAA
jgi:hypothetical protein